MLYFVSLLVMAPLLLGAFDGLHLRGRLGHGRGRRQLSDMEVEDDREMLEKACIERFHSF